MERVLYTHVHRTSPAAPPTAARRAIPVMSRASPTIAPVRDLIVTAVKTEKNSWPKAPQRKEVSATKPDQTPWPIDMPISLMTCTLIVDPAVHTTVLHPTFQCAAPC